VCLPGQGSRRVRSGAHPKEEDQRNWTQPLEAILKEINLNGSDMDKEVAKGWYDHIYWWVNSALLFVTGPLKKIAEQRAYNTLSYLLHWDEHGMIPYGHEPKKRWHYDYGTTSTPERGSDHSHDPSYHARRLIKMMVSVLSTGTAHIGPS
jgi:hypothetical protein